MRTLLRPVAVMASGLLATTLVATTLTSPAAAAPSDRSATWLGKQLTDGLVVGEYRDTWTDPENPVWVSYTDHGLTADVAIALDALGGHRRQVRRIGAALAPEVSAWTADGAYAGSVAKAAVTATVAGQDPTDVGGVDLVAQLEERTADAAPIAGRIEDQGDDYANTIGQAFAALGLAQAGSSEAAAARGFLLEQQCAEGFFRLNFSGKAAADQSCDGAAGAEPDTDVTALSVILLEALPTHGKKVNRALRDATAWLKAAQKRNGSLGGGVMTEASNANSTGLTAWALGETGSCARAERAATWVKKLQVRGKLRGTPLAGEKGAVAYDRGGYAAAEKHGIRRGARDQWRRATAQAAPGLRFVAGC